MTNIFENSRLANIPTEELLEELFTRHNNALFVATKEGREVNTVANVYEPWGSTSEILGLATFAQIMAQNRTIEHIED